MKKQILFLIGLIFWAVFIVISCKKDDTEPPPVDQTQIAWVVGQQDSNLYGNILYTEDGGETWERQGDSVLMSGIDLENLYVLDKKNVWIVGTNNTLFKTTDGGKTWVQVPTPVIPSNPPLSSISMPDHNTVWISGGNGVVMKTLNGGTNWTLYDTNFFHCGGMQGIYAINEQVVYVVGHFDKEKGPRGFIARTNDGGSSWDSIQLPDNYHKHSWIGVKATDINHVIIYGETGHYANTTDGGLSWNVADPIDPGDINSLVMLSNKIFWGACDFDQIYKTLDGGASWIFQSAQGVGPSNQYLVGIDALDSKTALIVGQSAGYSPRGKIIKTTNGGDTWVLKDTCKTNLYKVAYAKE